MKGEVMREKEYSEWMGKQGFDALRHANCCKIAFNGGWESRQTEVDELKNTIEKQKRLSLKAIENAKEGSSLELQLAQKLHAESSPDSLESERAMNAQLTNENLLLESKVDELQKRVDAVKQLIQEYHQHSYREADDFVFYLEQALKGGGK